MLIRDYLEMRAEQDGDKPFVTFREQTIDFAAMNRRVNQAANYLRDLGVKKADNVCLFLPNCPEFLYLWFGLAKIGGVMVPLNFNLKGDGLKYIINHCDAKLIVVHERLYDSYAFVEKDLPKIEHRLWCGEEKPAPANFQDLSRKLAASPQDAPPRIDVGPGDPSSIIYTSGTTGPPKGAVISHYNYTRTGKLWLEEILDKQPGDVLWTCLPLFHANAQMWTTMGSLTHAVPYVLRERFSASEFLDDIRATGATVFNYIGGILTMIMKQPEKENDWDNPLRWAFGGAAPKELWRDFERRFRLTIMEGYGLTETGAVVTHNPTDAIKMGSIGKPVSALEAAIWDDNLQPVPVGQSGEIVCREKETEKYFMFLGYYKQPDKTAEAWAGGWFHTGDRGYVDEEGYYYFLDRIKDCIRRRGENISSFDIEKIINSHPQVLESAAVAVPSELGEDDVKVYVVLREGEKLDPGELIKFCEERMAYFMVPRYVEFLKEFPKTATQRTQKFELRKLGLGQAWDREKSGYKLKRV